jgi:hypothetical protein
MKEFKTVGSIIQQHYPLRKMRQRKRWDLAQSRSHYEAQTNQNSSTEVAYHRVIAFVKELYLTPGEVCFERNYKYDKSDGLLGMHSFLTSTFWWRLDCSYLYEYEISLAFNRCPFEAEIREMMQVYPLDRTVIEKPLQPDFDTFYNTTLCVQEPQFIFTFKR